MRKSFVVLLSIVTISTFGMGGLAAAAGSLATQVVLAGPLNGGGEPSVAIAGDGTIYVSYPGDQVNMVVSRDHGRSWTTATSPEAPSGDTSVNVDTSGAVYQTNLNGIKVGSTDTLQADLFKSFNRGKTWPIKAQALLTSDNGTGQPLFVDRQWVDAVIPPHLTTDQARVYMEYHDFGPSQIWVETSTDGGAHFGAPVDVITSPLAQADSVCDTIPGGVKVVPYGRNPNGRLYKHPGRVYAAWLAADAASDPTTGCNLTQLAAFHSVWIAYSDDNGLTWTDQLVFDPGPLHDASEIFADLTLDNQGNPYIAFTMNINPEFDVWATASLDGGVTWFKPAKVNQDTGTHYFPAIAAGNPEQVVVTYIETSDVVPTTVYGKPQPVADQNSDWRVYLAQSLNIDGKAPAFTNKVVTPTPMHHGDVCTLGLFCAAIPGSNRNILDFIDVQVDPNGKAHAAFTGDNGDYQGIYVANQSGGPTVGPPGH